jgi:hypothetical protein
LRLLPFDLLIAVKRTDRPGDEIVGAIADERLAYTPIAVKLRELNLRKFFAELKRRNAYKVAIAYGVVASLFSQIATNFTALSTLQPCYFLTSLLRIARRIAVLPRSTALLLPFSNCYPTTRFQGP